MHSFFCFNFALLSLIKAILILQIPNFKCLYLAISFYVPYSHRPIHFMVSAFTQVIYWYLQYWFKNTCFICLSGTGLPHSHSVLVLHVQYPLGSVRILNLYQYPRHYELKDHEYGCEINCKVGCQDLLVYAMVV